MIKVTELYYMHVVIEVFLDGKWVEMILSHRAFRTFAKTYLKKFYDECIAECKMAINDDYMLCSWFSKYDDKSLEGKYIFKI